jgi:MFS family permease
LRGNRDFRAVFLAQLVSYAGDWFATVALIGLMLQLTHSAVAATGVFVSQMLPGFFATPLAGPAADRFDRRRLMIGVSLLQSLAALGFLLTGRSTIWMGFAAQASISALGSFFGPASQAAIPNLVDAEDLPTANALISSTWGSMLAIGAALGGAFTIAFGRPAAFIADAASFLVAAALIASVRRPTRDLSVARPDRMRPIADTRESLGYARRHPVVLALLASKMGFGLSSGVVGLLAVFATRKFKAGDTGIGLLLAARGIGVVVGPFLARRFIRGSRHALLRACGVAALVYAIAYAMLPLAPTIWLAAFVPLLAHLGGGAQWTLSTYGLQTATPDSLRGRIFAADFALVTLTMSLSFLASGALTQRYGPGPVTFGLTGIAALWGALYLTLTARLRDGAE